MSSNSMEYRGFSGQQAAFEEEIKRAGRNISDFRGRGYLHRLSIARSGRPEFDIENADDYAYISQGADRTGVLLRLRLHSNQQSKYWDCVEFDGELFLNENPIKLARLAFLENKLRQNYAGTYQHAIFSSAIRQLHSGDVPPESVDWQERAAAEVDKSARFVIQFRDREYSPEEIKAIVNDVNHCDGFLPWGLIEVVMYKEYMRGTGRVRMTQRGDQFIFNELLYGRHDLSPNKEVATDQIIAAGISVDITAEDVVAHDKWYIPVRNQISVDGAVLDIRLVPHRSDMARIALVDGYGVVLDSRDVPVRDEDVISSSIEQLFETWGEYRGCKVDCRVSSVRLEQMPKGLTVAEDSPSP